MGASEYREGGGDLLERGAELGGVEALVAGITAGHGHTIVVEGQAGLGKSRLLVAGAQQAADAAVSAALFTCGELESDLAWSAALGLLAAATHSLTHEERADLLAGAAGPVARLLDDPAGSGQGGELDPFALIHGLYVVIERVP